MGTPPKAQKDAKLGEPSWTLIVVGVAILVATAAAVYWAAHKGTVVTELTEGSKKTTTTKAIPSDTLLGVGLGLGGLLVLSGILWSKIKTIRGPGGLEIELTPDEAEKVNEAVVTVAKEKGKAAPEEVAPAVTKARAMARDRKAQKGSLATQDFRDVAERAL